ncbi:hypothetical protein J5N97_013708 [Dioscorea zingiberensis]|uniref:C2H2-type domain-containing protein n=1 Tax=Dioscorea zingiberensis TaxID=325984 RepID=A0A9D5CSG2_9LILI|nr:hypothetical protein J5N97_013708 [Dioscorea zingiberensis]
MATNRFVCEICNKGFQRDQNLQLHRRGHNLPWKLRQRPVGREVRRRVYVCPERNCVHHNPSRALGDLTGIKKHYCRKHGERKWKCEKCSKMYAVYSDWKAHMKVCGTREYKCDCGTIFSRRDNYVAHRAFCDVIMNELPIENEGVGLGLDMNEYPFEVEEEHLEPEPELEIEEEPEMETEPETVMYNEVPYIPQPAESEEPSYTHWLHASSYAPASNNINLNLSTIPDLEPPSIVNYGGTYPRNFPLHTTRADISSAHTLMSMSLNLSGGKGKGKEVIFHNDGGSSSGGFVPGNPEEPSSTVTQLLQTVTNNDSFTCKHKNESKFQGLVVSSVNNRVDLNVAAQYENPDQNPYQVDYQQPEVLPDMQPERPRTTFQHLLMGPYPTDEMIAEVEQNMEMVPQQQQQERAPEQLMRVPMQVKPSLPQWMQPQYIQPQYIQQQYMTRDFLGLGGGTEAGFMEEQENRYSSMGVHGGSYHYDNGGRGYN